MERAPRDLFGCKKRSKKKSINGWTLAFLIENSLVPTKTMRVMMDSHVRIRLVSIVAASCSGVNLISTSLGDNMAVILQRARRCARESSTSCNGFRERGEPEQRD
jgi:hypothetical protein